MWLIALSAHLGASSILLADNSSFEGDLFCDEPNNRVVLLFSDPSEVSLPKLPSNIDGGLTQLAPRPTRECRLSDGREVRAKISADQAYPWGMCGAEPASWFSLWLNQRKIFSKAIFSSCEFGFNRLAIVIEADHVLDCQLKIINGNNDSSFQASMARSVVCKDVSDEIRAKSEIDTVEYPVAGHARPPVGTIEITPGADQAFCEAFVKQSNEAEDGYHYGALPGLFFDNRLSGLVLARNSQLPSGGSGTRGKYEEIWSFRFDLDNDGALDDVRWIGSDTHAFHGSFLLIVPGQPSLQAKYGGPRDENESAEKYVVRAQSEGIAVYSGLGTPYKEASTVHWFAISHEGQTYLWAMPTYLGQQPTALLYKPLPGGILQRVCEYQRVEENY